MSGADRMEMNSGDVFVIETPGGEGVGMRDPRETP